MNPQFALGLASITGGIILLAGAVWFACTWFEDSRQEKGRRAEDDAYAAQLAEMNRKRREELHHEAALHHQLPLIVPGPAKAVEEGALLGNGGPPHAGPGARVPGQPHPARDTPGPVSVSLPPTGGADTNAAATAPGPGAIVTHPDTALWRGDADPVTSAGAKLDYDEDPPFTDWERDSFVMAALTPERLAAMDAERAGGA